MYIKRSVLLLILAAYILAPSVFSWMIDPTGTWYRPYLIWAGIVTMTLLTQWQRPHDEL